MKDCAIATYLDNEKWSLLEIQWLYRSWLFSKSCIRSDLVIFHNPAVDKSILPAGEGVHHIPLPPIYESEPLWGDYRRINSTWFMTSKEAEFVHRYQYTLRVDQDCFLTPFFVGFRPRLATFGAGVYETEGGPEVRKRLDQVYEKYGIKRTAMNVDNTIMAYSRHVTEYAKLQYEIIKRLKREEFQDGHGEWPGWYEYVINMYSAGIAASAYFRGGIYTAGLSCMSMCSDPIGSTDFIIHAYHTSQDFSKMKWRDGLYDNADFEALDPRIINQYCLKLAGKRGEL